jgi:hypothetical protein
MEQSLELHGHDEFVSALSTARAGDGRVLLLSLDTYGSRCVWDTVAGELVAGPFKRGEERAGLAALRFDPVEMARASGGTIVPATTRSPALVVTGGKKQVRVIDPESGSVVFKLRQPRDRRFFTERRGVIGNSIFETVGVRFGDGTAGFAAERWGGAIEIWAPARRSWPVPLRRRWLRDNLAAGGGMAALHHGSGGSHLAVLPNWRVIEIWDVTTRRQVARFDAPGNIYIRALTTVPLADGPILAALVEHGRDTGLQLCDPYQGHLVGEVFNRHGHMLRNPEIKAAILSLTAVPGPDGTVRVVSGGQDGLIRISPPIGKADDRAFTS